MMRNRFPLTLLVIPIFTCSIASLNGFPQSKPDISSATLTLDVRDCILMSLENNHSLAVERYAPEINKTFIAEEQAAFDPAFNSDISVTESKGQRTSGVGEFRGVSNRQKNLNVSVSKKTVSGVDIKLEASTNRRESNVYTRLFSTRLGTTVNVPILEGLGSQVNLVGVHQAEKDVELSQYELQGFVLALISQVEELYWNLISAREELRIHYASLDLANEQLKETKERIDVGDIAEIELAAAEGEMAVREEAVIDTQSACEKNALQLLQLINPQREKYWSLALDLIESPTLEETITETIDEDIAIALRSRPDLNQARVQLERNELDVVKTKNGLLPRLDFFITFGKSGYANSFFDSADKLDRNNFDLTTGLTFQYSFGNHAKRARNQRAEFSVKESKAAIANFEQLVELDVRTNWVELNRATRQIAATRLATRLQEAKYLAEVEKFRVGKSTNLLVLVSQRDLIQSRLDELRAQINKRIAVEKLNYAKGTLLDRHKIVLPSK